MKPTLLATAACSLLLAAAALGWGGLTTAFGVLVGGAVAIVNLSVITFLVRKSLGPTPSLWSGFGSVKLVGLFVVVGWLLGVRRVPAVPFVVGLLSLPVGTVAGALLSPPKDDPSASPPSE